jgi:hypothetical protein
MILKHLIAKRQSRYVYEVFSMNNQNEFTCIGPVYMPDGVPAPEVMTAQEAIHFLRLDEANLKNPATTLQYYRDKGDLKGIRIGKSIRYTKEDLLNFLRNQSQKTK